MILSISIKAGTTRPPLRPALPSVMKDLLGYGLCSALALALDCSLLYSLTWAGMNYLAAAAISFLSGMLLAYTLSIRFVYNGRRSANVKREALGFFAIGIAGLLLNQILLFGCVDGLQLSLIAAKGFTTLLVFLFNFVARRSLLFSGGDRLVMTHITPSPVQTPALRAPQGEGLEQRTLKQNC